MMFQGGESESLQRRESEISETDISQEAFCNGETGRRSAVSLKVLVPSKPEICRYHGMPGGCVRGEKCFYAHGVEDFQRRPRNLSPTTAPFMSLAKINQMSQEDLKKKVFVGGLSPSVESEYLRDLFEEKFGPVVDAVVIGSHSGDQVQSRGFGFVTFQYEESVLLAVKTHYVTLCGKKVEIKGAVPRSGLSQLEIAKRSPAMAMSTAVSADRKGGAPRSPDLNFHAESEVEGQWTKRMNQETEEPAFPEGASSSMTVSCSSPSAGSHWVLRFKQWLPKFLTEVYNRLKEGEWYPLSSLKGDFRATCGLELDHTGIGYQKLNDFIKCHPQLCRIKVVPVGLGPATHMVLLPVSGRAILTGPHQMEVDQIKSPITVTTLMNKSRSYADSISHGTLNGGTINLQSPVSSAMANMASLMRDYKHLDGYPRLGSSGDLMVRDTFQHLAENNVDGNSKLHAIKAPVFPSQSGTPAESQDLRPQGSQILNGTSRNSAENLDYLLFSGSNAGVQSESDVNTRKSNVNVIKNKRLTAKAILVTSHDVHHGNLALPSANGRTDIQDLTDYITNEAPVHRQTMINNLSEEPKTPGNQVSLTPFSTYDNQPKSFLTRDKGSASSSYNMWGQSFPNFMISNDEEKSVQHTEIKKQQKSARGFGFHSGGCKGQWTSQDTPVSVLHALSNDQDGDQFLPTCMFCLDQQSLWVAMPCKDYAICSSCKDALYKSKGSTSPCICSVCYCVVERWEAVLY